MDKLDYLSNWLFTRNEHTGNWRACTRDQYLDFFSKSETLFIRSEYIEDLQDLIIKYQGDTEKLNKLI